MSDPVIEFAKILRRALPGGHTIADAIAATIKEYESRSESGGCVSPKDATSAGVAPAPSNPSLDELRAAVNTHKQRDSDEDFCAGDGCDCYSSKACWMEQALAADALIAALEAELARKQDQCTRSEVLRHAQENRAELALNRADDAELALGKSETDRANMTREAHGWKKLVDDAERERDEARRQLDMQVNYSIVLRRIIEHAARGSIPDEVAAKSPHLADKLRGLLARLSGCRT